MGHTSNGLQRAFNWVGKSLWLKDKQKAQLDEGPPSKREDATLSPSPKKTRHPSTRYSLPPIFKARRVEEGTSKSRVKSQLIEPLSGFKDVGDNDAIVPRIVAIDLSPSLSTSATGVTEENSDISAPIPFCLNIVIVGAGIGGLAAGFLLGRAGHKVTILEGASRLGEVGAGMQLSPNVTRLLIRWGAAEKLKKVAVAPQSLTLRRYENGEVVGWKKWGETIEKEHGSPYYHIHRADLHQILLELAEPFATIRTSAQVEEIDPSTALLTLASRETIEADLIIGADGLHSRVRDVVVGEKDTPTPTGDAAYRAVIPAEALLADPDLKLFVKEHGVNIWMGPRRHVVAYCVRNKELYNLVMVHPARDDDERAREKCLEELKADFEDFEPRVTKLLELVPSAIVWTLKDRQPLETWIHREGKVCLLGDACHPMLPYRAQGAAMALEDAAVLGNLFSRLRSPSEVASLLQAYQTIRHFRATATQTASRLNQHIFHLPDGPAQEARDNSMRVAMAEALKEVNGESTDGCAGNANAWGDREKNREAFDYDADEEVERWWKQHRLQANDEE